MPPSTNTRPNHAAHLVQALADSLGLIDAGRKFEDETAFAGMRISYRKNADLLKVDIFVAKTWWAGADKGVQENFRKVAAVLNDPKIGGMYPRGDGTFVFDEANGYYLTKEIVAVERSADAFVATIARQRTLATKWTTSWFAQVARIAHGRMPPPDVPIPE